MTAWAELWPDFAIQRIPCAERASAHGLIARNNHFWEIEKADPVENGYDVTVLLKLSEEFVFSDTQDFADTLEVIMEIRGEKPYVANTEEIADSISG